MGCPSSFDSLSGLNLGGEGGAEPVESLVEVIFSLGDSAALDLFSVSGEAPSLVRDDFQGLFLVERVGLLVPDRPPVEGLRPRPRPDDGRRTRLSF